MIGVICAMPQEAEAFLAAYPDGAKSRDGSTEIRIGEHAAMIASAGLGKVGAAMTAVRLIERFGCRGLVSAGTAGGLEGSEPMQVIVGLDLVQHDYGRSRGLGRLDLYRPGLPPLPEYQDRDYALRVNDTRRREYVALARDIEFVRFGTFASGDTFVNDADTRQRLIDLGAVAVDMESAAVAQVAEHHGLPWLVAKGISDDVSADSHEDFLDGLAEASRRSAQVVATLLPALSI